MKGQPPFHHIKFGDNLSVTDEGGGVIRVDGNGGSLSAPGGDPLIGDVTLSEGAGIDLTQVGQDIEIANIGVLSVAKDGSTALVGDVTLSEGTGVTLTQVGQDIEIAAAAGGGSSGIALPGHRLGVTENRWYLPGSMTILSLPTAVSAIGRKAWPFIPSRDMTLDRVGCQVTAGIASSSLRLGIYEDDGNLYPGALLYDSGAISTVSTGSTKNTVSIALTAGTLYWFVMHNSHASVQYRGAQIATTIPLLGCDEPTGTTAPNMGCGWFDTAAIAALPDPFTAGASPILTSTAERPGIFVRGT